MGRGVYNVRICPGGEGIKKGLLYRDRSNAIAKSRPTSKERGAQLHAVLEAHAAHTAHTAHATTSRHRRWCLVLGGVLGQLRQKRHQKEPRPIPHHNHALARAQQRCDTASVDKGSLDDLERIEDTRVDHVRVLALRPQSQRSSTRFFLG
jgi:hypothetical protein